MKRKWTLFTFSRGDFKTLERYLNEQAEQGWELEKAGILAKWKRTQRTDLTYCVDLAKPRQDRNERVEYAEFCAEGGWELAAFTGNMYLFKSRPGERPIPIQTDRELERKNYNRYYIRNSILGVVFLLAYLGFFSLLGADALGAFQELSNQWMTDWLGASLYAVLPLWGLWAVWKLVDFARATIKGRTGSIGHSPRWVMWTNCAMALIFGIGAVLLYIGMALEFLLGAKMFSYVEIFLLIWSGVLLWRAFEMEGELFRGERRRYVALGLGALLVFAALVVGRIFLPHGYWSISPFSMNEEKGVAAYARSHEAPLVHGEDVGVAFEPEEGEAVYIAHEVNPVGRTWELTYAYGAHKTSFRYMDLGSATTECVSEGAAKLLVGVLIRAPETERYRPYDLSWPVDGLVLVDLDWADEAWYGVCSAKSGEDVTVLVLRVGKQVTRMAYPADLMSGENLAAIRAELEK